MNHADGKGKVGSAGLEHSCGRLDPGSGAGACAVSLNTWTSQVCPSVCLLIML